VKTIYLLIPKVKKVIPFSPLQRTLRLYWRQYRAKTFGYSDWKKIISKDIRYWKKALGEVDKKEKVLIATSTGGYLPAVQLESMLACALTLRKANVSVFLCDGILPACFECDITWYPNLKRFVLYGPQDLCKSCFKPARKMYESLGIKVYRYSEFVSCREVEDKEIEEIISSSLEEAKKYRWKGIAIGEHALAGALRFLGRGDLKEEKYAKDILRRYLKASMITSLATLRLLEKEDFKVAVFHHGIYVPQGLIGEVCRKKGIRVVNWNPAYRKRCFIFSEKDTYHHTLISEPTEKWENIFWDSKIEKTLMDYLKSRWYGTQDWIWFHENPNEDLGKIVKETGIDFSRPCIGLLTNVYWDAQLHYPTNAFPNMLEWIFQTIEYFFKRKELQLIIRVHPAEVKNNPPSRQKVEKEIRRRFPKLSSNIFIIPPHSPISTYKVMSQCDSVIIYGTKMGVELTAIGIPVIVAGEAWIRNKGITIDISSPQEYFKILDKLPLRKKLNGEKLQRARKYAFHFFFRRMIPIKLMEPLVGVWPPYRLSLSTLYQLLPGKDLGLDIICDGILKNKEFIYPYEKVSIS